MVLGKRKTLRRRVGEGCFLEHTLEKTGYWGAGGQKQRAAGTGGTF